MKVIRIIDTACTDAISRWQLSLIALNDVLSPVERALSSCVSLEKLYIAEMHKRARIKIQRPERDKLRIAEMKCGTRDISDALLDALERTINLSPSAT